MTTTVSRLLRMHSNDIIVYHAIFVSFLSPRMAKHKYYDYEKKRPDHSGSENSAYQFKSNSMTHYQNQYQKSLSQNQNTHEQTHTYDVNISGYVTSFSYPVGTEFPQNLAEQIESISNYLELSTQVHFTQIGPGYTHSSAQIVHAVLNRKGWKLGVMGIEKHGILLKFRVFYQVQR